VDFLEVLLTAFLELFGDVLIQIVLEFLFNGVTSVRRALPDTENKHPGLQAVGWSVVGAAVGGLSLAIYREPLFHRGRLPGVSLLLSPLLTGVVMEQVGRLRAARGKPPQPLSNFRNGAAFAFGFALVRFLFAKAAMLS